MTMLLMLANVSRASGRLYLRDGAGILLSKGPHIEVSLGKMLNPKTAPYVPVGTLAATAISVWMYVWITVSRFAEKLLINALKCKC